MAAIKSALNGVLPALGLMKYEPPKIPSIFDQINAELPDDLQRRKEHIAGTHKFNGSIALLIVLNTLIMGIEIDNGMGDALEDRMVFFACDVFFAVVFFSEMLFRQHQLGWDYFMDTWNVMDYALVVLNVADVITSVSSKGGGGVKLASTLRVIRLLRVVRTIRGIRMFHGLWLVLQGLLDSLRTMAWVLLLLIIMLYIAAVALVTLVGQEQSIQQSWIYSDRYVGSVWRAMWTVLEVATLDVWASEVVRPLLIANAPEGVIILFGAIVVITFGTFNLIIALMVERMQVLEQETKDKNGKVLEKTEHKLLQSMGEDFQEADKDGSGELDYEEFEKLIRTTSLSYKLRLLGIQADEALNLFELMDADNSGAVSPEEFITGLQKIKGPAKGQDLVQLICFMQKQTLRASLMVSKVRWLNERADDVQLALNALGKGMSSELEERLEAEKRNDTVWSQAAHREVLINKLDQAKRIQYPPMPALN